MSHEHDLYQFGLFRNGSKAAFEYFFHRHNKFLYHYALTLGGGTELAEQLTCLAFQALWDERRKIEDETHLRDYLYGTARNFFFQYLKTSGKANAIEADQPCLAKQVGSFTRETGVLQEQVFRGLEDAIRRLTHQRRVVLNLMYFKGMDVTAIAEELKLPPQTVRNHKTKAVNFLYRELTRRGLPLPLLLTILWHTLP